MQVWNTETRTFGAYAFRAKTIEIHGKLRGRRGTCATSHEIWWDGDQTIVNHYVALPNPRDGAGVSILIHVSLLLIVSSFLACVNCFLAALNHTCSQEIEFSWFVA
jgi:hypothetical protein